MSLINEALKRTRDASYEAAAPRPAGAEPYRVSAATPAVPRRQTSPVIWVMLGVLGVIVVAAVLAFLRLNRTTNVVAEALKPTAPVAVPAVPPPAEPVASKPAPVVAAPVPVAPVESPSPAPETPVTTPPAPVATSAPAPEPKFILQGITIDPMSGREALINGISLRVGEEIDGAKVLAIEARRVLLTYRGHELALRMP